MADRRKQAQARATANRQLFAPEGMERVGMKAAGALDHTVRALIEVLSLRPFGFVLDPEHRAVRPQHEVFHMSTL